MPAPPRRLRAFVERAHANGAGLYVAGASPLVRTMLAREKVDIPPARFAPTVPEARKAAARDGAVQPEG